MNAHELATITAAILDPQAARRWLDDTFTADVVSHADVYQQALELTADERTIFDRLIAYAQGKITLDIAAPEFDDIMGKVHVYWQKNRLPVSRKTCFKIIYCAESASTDRDDPDGWYQDAVSSIRRGEIDYDILVDEMGEQWANELFEKAGKA